LGPDQPVFGLVEQSQDGKPARHTEVETIAAHYLEEIRTVRPKGPYFLGGYSFGGTVAVEMAQQLKRQGEEVSVLFLLDPDIPVEQIPDSVNRSTRIPWRDEAKRHLRNLVMLRPRDKLVYILVRIGAKIKERTPRISKISRTSKRILCKFYPAMGRSIPLFLRSDYILDMYGGALRSYVPQPYPGPPICFTAKCSHDPRLDWGRLLTGELAVYELPGDHLDLVSESYVRLWAEKLKDALQRAQETVNDKKGELLSQSILVAYNYDLNRPSKMPIHARLE
jgi:thioesterase domain-containing protein